MNLRFVDVDPQGEAAQSLLRAAAVEVRALYDDVLAPDRPWPTNDRLGPRDVYVVAYCDQQPIGCGALREIDRITAEVRRMYVLREHRRNRVGHAVLTHLAAEAKRLGYERLRLETGNKQARAVALYEAFGFRRIAPFGKYENDPTSVCFELQLHHEVCMQDEICVFTASGEMQAQQIQGFLAGSGISSELRGESLRKTHGLTIDGLGRVEVVVSKDDEEQARALLASAEQGAFRLDEDAQVQE